jgi:IS4 transposase
MRHAQAFRLLAPERGIIELFFRFFKQILGCRHLYFHSENGIKLQAYCAIIACMLLCLWTGRIPP